jgi:two-component system chemotaxis response regulator CheY
MVSPLFAHGRPAYLSARKSKVFRTRADKSSLNAHGCFVEVALWRMPRGVVRQGRCLLALDVMIVDDSAAIRKILQRVLIQAGFPIGAVHEATDGNEALAVLKTHKVGLILSDINMPNMDGIELLTKLKADAVLKSVPIVMVTTEGSQARVLQALELGAAGYIRKPFTAEQIKEKLGGVI